MKSSVNVAERSFEPITLEDLEKLAAIAREDRIDFFHRRSDTADLYSDRLLCVALCQGAALHFVNGSNGVKDFDVWSFYYEHPQRPFPYRRRGTRDFGLSKFGRNPNDTSYVGRRVDLIGRSLKRCVGADPVKAIQSYLRNSGTQTSGELAKKAVVIIDPPELRGKVVWPMPNK